MLYFMECIKILPMDNIDWNYEPFWTAAKAQLKSLLSDQEYVMWFANLLYDSSDKHQITLSAPSAFYRDQVMKRYYSVLKEVLDELTGCSISIEFVIKKRSSAPKDDPPAAEEPQKKSFETLHVSRNISETTDNRGFNPDYSFENFVIGDNSSFAYNASLAIAKNPGTNYNPCLIYGGVGLGKTHLIQSIGNYILNNNKNIKISYVTAESFTNEFIQAIGQGKHQQQQFKNTYRKVDILLVDDIHFLQNKSSTQEELFHTFNSLYDSNKQMVFTCDRPVSELKELTARLRSRFERGLNVDLQPPDFETRMAILQKKCLKQNFSMPDEVLEYISRTINTNVRDLESSLTKLIAYSRLLNKEITLNIAMEQLKDSFSIQKEQTFTIESIQKVVGEYFNLSHIDLKGKKRTKAIVFPRQIAMYISRNMTDLSTTEIGYDFGGRDHSTVMHACQRVESRLQTDPVLDGIIQRLMRQVKEYRRSIH